jgi:hypothetical protein
MITSTIDSIIQFRHTSAEVAQLNEAVIPLASQIMRCSHHVERQKMKAILNGEYFRANDASIMVSMLLRACKYARANLNEYFPGMRADILIQVQELNDSARNYRAMFNDLKAQSSPTL